MKLLGYCYPWSGVAGEVIEFMVSSEAPHFEVDFVRLLQGDDRLEAPPYREYVVPLAGAGRYAGRR